METFANNAVGNLNAAITLVGATSFVLQAGHGALFPATGNFRVVIDSEIMIVGARSGDTLSSITRGAEGTAAATHLIAAPVTHELTAGALVTLTQGMELTYNEWTVNVSITATTEATANTIVTASAFTFDGTAAMVEVFSPQVTKGTTRTDLYLYDGANSIGNIAEVAGATGVPVYGRRRLTPSAGSHTYSLRGSVDAGTGVAVGQAGGVAAQMPGFIRITKV